MMYYGVEYNQLHFLSRGKRKKKKKKKTLLEGG